jgi:hypothetical protein
MKNQIFLTSIAVFCIGVAFYSCTDGGIPKNIDTDRFLYVYLASANDEPTALAVPVTREGDTVVSVGWVAYGGTTNYHQGKIEAALGVDRSLIDAYNASHTTEYLPLPYGSFSIDHPELTIEDGQHFSETAHLTISPAYLETGEKYLLPVTIASLSTTKLPLNGDRKTAWWIVYLDEPETVPEMEKDTWQVIDWSSSWGASYLPELVIDNDIETYWHTNADGSAPDSNLPHWLIIDMQQNRLIHGIDIWNRQNLEQGSTPRNILFELSDNLDTWRTLLEETMLPRTTEIGLGTPNHLPAQIPMTGRYLKVTIKTTYAAFYTYIAEITPY